MSTTRQMSVRVLFFASLREAVGIEGVTLILSQGTFAELRSHLTQQLGDAAAELWADNVRLARNQELLDAGTLNALQLADGDELAFLPPVTGG